MIPLIAESNVVYIMMHMQNRPQNMQLNPLYKNVIAEVFQFLDNKIKEFTTTGIHDIIIDVGFGFGKTLSHNYELLRNLSYFKNLGKPILAGISRKSIVTKVIQAKPADALNGTTALHMAALMQGANILRVHDVKEAKQCIDLYLALKDKQAIAHV
jgi:dihydropteroate synthase